jgi:hypothetical protein
LLTQDKNTKSAKMQKAIDWGCKIVTMEWLYSCLETGIISGLSSKRSPLKILDQKISQERESIVPSLQNENDAKSINKLLNKQAEVPIKPATLMVNLDPLEQLLFDEGTSVIHAHTSQITNTTQRKKRTIQIEEEISTAPTIIGQQGVSYDDHDSISLQHDFFASSVSTKKVKFKQRCIMFSGVTPSDRQMIAKEVPNLGGVCIINDKWDPDCTHLVVNNPQKTEKFLAACASGAWYFLLTRIVNINYINESVKQGKFVEEEAYLEIGEFTSVSKFWCRYYQKNGKKAFDGWNVELNVSSNKEFGFKRLLSAGNGSTGPGGFTLIEKHKFKQNTSKSDTQYVDSTFLIDYLLSMGEKDRNDYLVGG